MIDHKINLLEEPYVWARGIENFLKLNPIYKVLEASIIAYKFSGFLIDRSSS